MAESRLDGRREGKTDGRGGKSLLIAKYRWLVGVLATFLSNIHIANFAKGSLYRGKAKSVCVPGLNCYSCPAATGACPIGAFQAVVGSADFGFSYYIRGLQSSLGSCLAVWYAASFALLGGSRSCCTRSLPGKSPQRRSDGSHM